MCVGFCECMHVCVCGFVCVRACVYMCVRVCVCARPCVCVYDSCMCVFFFMPLGVLSKCKRLKELLCTLYHG